MMIDQVYASWTVGEMGPERARWNERKADCADGT